MMARHHSSPGQLAARSLHSCTLHPASLLRGRASRQPAVAAGSTRRYFGSSFGALHQPQSNLHQSQSDLHQLASDRHQPTLTHWQAARRLDLGRAPQVSSTSPGSEKSSQPATQVNMRVGLHVADSTAHGDPTVDHMADPTADRSKGFAYLPGQASYSGRDPRGTHTPDSREVRTPGSLATGTPRMVTPDSDRSSHPATQARSWGPGTGGSDSGSSHRGKSQQHPQRSHARSHASSSSYSNTVRVRTVQADIILHRRHTSPSSRHPSTARQVVPSPTQSLPAPLPLPLSFQ